MRGNELLDKMGLIDLAYIEAADVKPKKKDVWVKWGVVAACLFLVAVGALSIVNLHMKQYVVSNNILIAPIDESSDSASCAFVTPEQAERIAGFITSFEDKVAEGLIAINKEFGENSKLSEAAKYEIAAKMV